jgi:hypothetical protein
MYGCFNLAGASTLLLQKKRKKYSFCTFFLGWCGATSTESWAHFQSTHSLFSLAWTTKAQNLIEKTNLFRKQKEKVGCLIISSFF